MSVLVTGKVPGDAAKFREFIANQPDIMRRIADEARSKGCLHHQFGIGDGFVIVIDEWESAEAFDDFFRNNADIPTVMRDAGAQGEPEFTFAEAVETVDRF